MKVWNKIWEFFWGEEVTAPVIVPEVKIEPVESPIESISFEEPHHIFKHNGSGALILTKRGPDLFKENQIIQIDEHYYKLGKEEGYICRNPDDPMISFGHSFTVFLENAEKKILNFPHGALSLKIVNSRLIYPLTKLQLTLHH